MLKLSTLLGPSRQLLNELKLGGGVYLGSIEQLTYVKAKFRNEILT